MVILGGFILVVFWVSGFGILGFLGFRVWGFAFGVKGLGFWVWGLRFWGWFRV